MKRMAVVVAVLVALGGCAGTGALPEDFDPTFEF